MFKKILFFTLFLAIPVFYTIWGGEHEPVKSGEEIEKQVEAKQQDLEKQREQKAQAETAYREAEKRAQEAEEKLSDLGYTGYIPSWLGGSSGEYNTLWEEKNNAINQQEDAEKNINAAQKKIEQLQKDMVTLAEQYTPQTSTQDLSDLQKQMDDALKNKDFDSFNANLQNIIAKTDRADKFAVLTNAVEDVAKAYPNDLTAQVEALKKIELTLNLMFAEDSKLPAYLGAQRNIDDARAKVQAKIDERSPWYSALQQKDISVFKKSLDDLYRKKKTDEERKFLLRDVFDQISVNLEVGSTQWFEALDGMFVEYAIGIPTEKAGVDLKEELLNSAVDLVNAKLKPDNPDWRKALNTLYEYDDPLGSKEVQKRITNELRKEEIKTHDANLNDLLKEGELADYENALEDSLAKLDTQAKIVLINNQYSTAAGQYGVNNYPEQVDVLSVLSSVADPAKFVPFYKETAQASYDEISGRKEEIESRVKRGQENLADTLQSAGNVVEKSSIIDRELFVAKNLVNEVLANPKESYASQEAFLTDLAKTAEEFKGTTLIDLSRADISNRLDEIKKFNPEKPATFSNDIEKDIWWRVPEDKISFLQQTYYNKAIDQLTAALEKNDANSVKRAQDDFQQIKDLIDKYNLTSHNETFAKNVEAARDFAEHAFEAAKPVELTAEEKNVLTKLSTGEALNEKEAVLLAEIGTKKMLSFVAANISAANLGNVDTVATILEKAPIVAKMMGKLMQRFEAVINPSPSDSWYAKVLLGGSTVIAAPLVKRYLTAQYGESAIGIVEKIASKVPEVSAFVNSASFQDTAKAIESGAKAAQSTSGFLKNMIDNVNLNAKNIENIPQKELPETFNAISSLERRLKELGAFDPDTTTQSEEANVPEQQKGFFARIKDYFSSFVDDVKKWVTSLFAGDTGIPNLEKKFAAAQEAYKNSNTPTNAQALTIAAQNLQNKYQEVIGSVVTYKELGKWWNNVVMDKDVAMALQKDPINMDILNQAVTAVLQANTYNAVFLDAMDEINTAVTAATKETALEEAYPKLFNDIVMGDYVKQLRDTQQQIKKWNESYTDYKSKLQDAIAKTKQPSVPAQVEIPLSGQQGQTPGDILGAGN